MRPHRLPCFVPPMSTAAPQTPDTSPPPRPRRARWRWIAWPLLLAVIVAALWWRLQSSAAPAADRAGRTQVVSAAPVQRQTVPVVVRTIGTFIASNTATVHAQVAGVLQALRFKEGEWVHAGQLLAEIDPRAFQASLAAAQGTLARDRAQLDNARFDLQRYQALQAQDAIAQQQVDTQRATVHQLEGTVLADEAAVSTAQLQLSYTRVTSPIDGRAGLKQVDLGNLVQQSDANGLVTVAQSRPIALVLAVPARHAEEIATALREHRPLGVEAWDSADTRRLALGRVAALDNAIDTATDTVKLKALFDNADDRLFPNQSVSVHLQLHDEPDALTVPTAALQRGAQGFFVYQIDATRHVHACAVQPGAVDGERTAVRVTAPAACAGGALQPGETVVTEGLDRLRDGAPVEVVDPRAAAAGSASAPRAGQRHHGHDARS